MYKLVLFKSIGEKKKKERKKERKKETHSCKYGSMYLSVVRPATARVAVRHGGQYAGRVEVRITRCRVTGGNDFENTLCGRRTRRRVLIPLIIFKVLWREKKKKKCWWNENSDNGLKNEFFYAKTYL